MKRRAGHIGAAARRLMRSRSMPLRAIGLGAAAGLALANVAGCVHIGPNNPAFALSHGEARALLSDLSARPAPPELPVLVLSGYHDASFSAVNLALELQRLTGGQGTMFLALQFPFHTTERSLVDDVIRAVEATWPSGPGPDTIELDVVGISMGGLAARSAALPAELDERGAVLRKRLRIRTLYTLATPHRGAMLARYVAPDPIARAMRPGSEMIDRLDRHLRPESGPAPYRVVAYAKLRDIIVGARNAAPFGQNPIWVNGLVVGSHSTVQDDPRVLADLALRLRGEQPIAQPSPPPTN